MPPVIFYFSASEILYTFARFVIQRFPNSQLNETIGLLDDRITESRRALGLFQHHDGVTGTAKPHVAADYNKRYLSSSFSHLSLIRSLQTFWITSFMGFPFQAHFCVGTLSPGFFNFFLCVAKHFIRPGCPFLTEIDSSRATLWHHSSVD